MTAVSPILLNFELWTNKTDAVPFVPDLSTQKSNHNSTIENHLVWAVNTGSQTCGLYAGFAINERQPKKQPQGLRLIESEPNKS